ncbi:MAG TPA: hydrogenase maturation nickel metallochaperone HypA [Solirubrobacteraceae bacterium]
MEKVGDDLHGECNTQASARGAGLEVQGPTNASIGELSIAQAVIDIATRHARGRTVTAIELRVGHEREVAPVSLDFAFALLTVGTALDGAELEIKKVVGGELAVDAVRLRDMRVCD